MHHGMKDTFILVTPMDFSFHLFNLLEMDAIKLKGNNESTSDKGLLNSSLPAQNNTTDYAPPPV
jgi:hypothetical protein